MRWLRIQPIPAILFPLHASFYVERVVLCIAYMLPMSASLRMLVPATRACMHANIFTPSSSLAVRAHVSLLDRVVEPASCWTIYTTYTLARVLWLPIAPDSAVADWKKEKRKRSSGLRWRIWFLLPWFFMSIHCKPSQGSYAQKHLMCFTCPLPLPLPFKIKIFLGGWHTRQSPLQRANG